MASTWGPTGNSSASDAIAMGSHVGTHIDALCHFSCGGSLYDGEDAAASQSYGQGLSKFSIDTDPADPAPRRAAGHRGTSGCARRSRRISRSPPSISMRPSSARAWRSARAMSCCCGPVGRITSRMPGEVHFPGPRTGSGDRRSAMAECPRSLCGGLRYRGLREGARRGNAGPCASAGGIRHPHHRVPESGGTRGGQPTSFCSWPCR